jgi:hypothetical protein
VRLAEAHGRLVSPPELPVSAPRWPVIARTVLFADLVQFVGEASLRSLQSFIGVADAVIFSVSAILVVTGILALGVVATALYRGASARHVRPLLALGGSLLGIVALDWWATSSTAGRAPWTRWGWRLVHNWVSSFDPSAWRSALRGSQGTLGVSVSSSWLLLDRLYLPLTLFLLLTIAVSGGACVLRLSRQPPRRPALVRQLVIAAALLTVTAVAWLWAADLTGGYATHGQAWAIAAILTASGAATLASTTIRDEGAPAIPE